MDFIFMLTRHDQTVVDCLAVFEDIRPLKLGHVGFKDIGVDKPTIQYGVEEAIASGIEQVIMVTGATSGIGAKVGFMAFSPPSPSPYRQPSRR